MAPMDEEDKERDQALVEFALQHEIFQKRSPKALVKALHDINEVKKHEVPKRVSMATPEVITPLCRRFRQVLEMPLKRYSRHLKPALFRRIHVGTMDSMNTSFESYRQTFDFVEMTNTWHDTDTPWREIPENLKEIGCKYKGTAEYETMAKRARDGFKMVVKVSHVATHVTKLSNPEEWWPLLYEEKYSKLESATAAYLWQFPPAFKCDRENWTRLEGLAEYLHSSLSKVADARHIVDFRHGSWYHPETYEFLRKKRWCLAWLHLNNVEDPATGRKWAGDLPTGWTDRVQTTNFCFMRLFGPQGATHGTYNKRFLHELFDGCPAGATSYVLFGNREELNNPNPEPRPAVRNAIDFRTIFTKMDFVERIRSVRYQGEAPRAFNTGERLLINSFYLRYSQKARLSGVKMVTPVGATKATKYKPEALPDKRSFEWKDPRGPGMMHIGLHDAVEDHDLWKFFRQLSGLEDLQATREWVKKRIEAGGKAGKITDEERALVNGGFIRWSERARQAGLLSTTNLLLVRADGFLVWSLSNGTPLKLSIRELMDHQDIWRFFVDLCRVSPTDSLAAEGDGQDGDPWKDDSWKAESGSMWKQEWEDCHEEKEEAALTKADEVESVLPGDSAKRPADDAGDNEPLLKKICVADPGADEPAIPQLGAWRQEKPSQMWSEWIRWESNTAPGEFWYTNTETNEKTQDIPPPLQATWESYTSPGGEIIYMNKETNESTTIAPPLP
eukprot:TRINITY_DN44652_c0_g1_i1.p1 TRINITY_DN44652_c0_g1~~TRINITY_DN44652_c0_g1_i1.p1  ORF type:complete len:730 (-),score=152.63 TRINITY_DN44652_c0_g1_i1:195-2384(-)